MRLMGALSEGVSSFEEAKRLAISFTLSRSELSPFTVNDLTYGKPSEPARIKSQSGLIEACDRVRMSLSPDMSLSPSSV